MDNQERNELIEDYLNGNLPKDRRAEVEKRMAADGAFRNEVELNRKVNEHFHDAKRQHLRAILQKVREEHADTGQPPKLPMGNRFGNLWKWAMLVTLVAAGFLFFKQKKSEDPVSPTVPTIDQPATPLNPAVPNQIPKEKPARPPVEKPAPRPIAQLFDPKDFQRNPAMDNLVEFGLKSDGLKVFLSSPATDAVFVLDEKGRAAVRFSGIVEGIDAGQNLEANLLIFNNRDSKNTLAADPLNLAADNAGKAVFKFDKPLGLKPGLYYFSLEETETGELLKAGRFLIKN